MNQKLSKTWRAFQIKFRVLEYLIVNTLNEMQIIKHNSPPLTFPLMEGLPFCNVNKAKPYWLNEKEFHDVSYC